ncbi:Carbohydrate Esterase Family 5 protein, partial [Tuber magnatum]
ANFLAKEPDPPSTIDDLISGVCTDVIIIWARGTGSTGNVGSALGRCFFTYMKGNLDYTIMAQGVLPYAANIRGIFWGGSPRGARSMVMMVMLAVEQCPRSKIVLAGFSQGAQILRKAVKRIPASVTENIVAVVSFSDYKEGQLLNGVLKDRHLSFCIEGDWVCDGKNTIVT